MASNDQNKANVVPVFREGQMEQSGELQAGWPYFWSLAKSQVEQELLGMYEHTREKTGTGNSRQGLIEAK